MGRQCGHRGYDPATRARRRRSEINGRPRSKEQPDGEQAVDYLRTFLPIPEGCGVLCVIALGYSDFEPKPLPAGEPVERVQWVE